MGLALFSPDEERSAIVTAILTPDGVDARELVLALRERFGITVAGAMESSARACSDRPHRLLRRLRHRRHWRRSRCSWRRVARTWSAASPSRERSRRTTKPSVSDSARPDPGAHRRVRARASERFDVVEDAESDSGRSSASSTRSSFVPGRRSTPHSSRKRQAEGDRPRRRWRRQRRRRRGDAARIVVANAPEQSCRRPSTIALLLAVARNVPQRMRHLPRHVGAVTLRRREDARRARPGPHRLAGGAPRSASECGSSRTTRT